MASKMQSTSAEYAAMSTGETAIRPNALSNRVTSVLSTSYADPEIREALEILDEQGFQNTPEARRQLRFQVQKEVIDCNSEIIRQFGHVSEQLQNVGAVISRLNEHVAQLEEQVSAARRDAGPVVEEAGQLLARRQQVQVKQQLLDRIISRFTVSEEVRQVLTSSSEPVDDRFFQALADVRRIHSSCQVLLGSEHQTLGLDIMQQSSKILNGAFEKLYRWIHTEFETLDLENPQIKSPIRRCLRVLAQRPMLLQNSLDSLAESRERILTDAFHTALTGPGANERSRTKPIELSAHDPLRYVGDMLAWVHSTSVSEREALEVLFTAEGHELAEDMRAGRENDPWERSKDIPDEEFDSNKALNGLVSRSLKGVGRLAKQRIENVITASEEATTVYRLATIIGFYETTFQTLLGADTPIVETLRRLRNLAQDQFRVLMNDAVLEIQEDAAELPADLGAPAFLEPALKQLRQILESYNTWFASEPATEQQQHDFRPVLEQCLDPFLLRCEQLAAADDQAAAAADAANDDDDERQRRRPAKDIFELNCLFAAAHELRPFAFAAPKAAEIGRKIAERAERLVASQHEFLLRASGLRDLVNAVAGLPDGDEDGALAAIPSLPPFQPHALSAASHSLDSFLPSAILDATERLKPLQDSKMARDVTEAAASRFCDDFERVESKILAVDERLTDYADEEKAEAGDRVPLRTLFPRTSAEIRVLLS